MSTVASAPVDTSSVKKNEERTWKLAFAITLFTMYCTMDDYNSFGPMLPDLQKTLNMNYAQLGLFTGMIGPIGIVFGIPMGMLIKKAGVKPSVLLGMAGSILGVSILAASPDAFAGISGRAVWVLGFRLASIALSSAVALVAPKHIVTLLISIQWMLSNASAVVNSPVGGWLTTSFSWRAALWVNNATTVLGFILFWIWFKTPAQKVESADVDLTLESTGEELIKGNALTSPLAWGIAVLAGLFTICSTSILAFSPAALKQLFNYSAQDIGFINGAAFAFAILLVLLAGILATRFNTRKWVLVGLFLCIAASAVGLQAQDRGVFAIAAGLMIAFVSGGPSAMVYSMAPYHFETREVPAVFSLIAVVGSAAAYVGPQTLGLLRDTTGAFTVGWYVLLGVAVVGAGATTLLRVK